MQIFVSPLNLHDMACHFILSAAKDVDKLPSILSCITEFERKTEMKALLSIFKAKDG